MTGTLTRRAFAATAVASGVGLSSALKADVALAQTRRTGLPGHDDTLWKGTTQMNSADAPVSIQSATLIVNDLTRVGDFYQSVLGLDLLRGDGESQELGAGGNTLLVLQKDVHARRYPHEAGLFHNAFLMPDRAALGRWLLFAAETGVQLTGAADHEVSEALYLDDPEGNGIEIYVDRPTDAWRTKANGQIEMGSYRLDMNAIAAAADAPWNGAPEEFVIGHVHLQVGDVEAHHTFMTQELGQDLRLFEGSVGFYATGGYHHHFAGNIWNSQSAGQRSPNSTGLSSITLRTDGTRLSSGTLTDPWGTRYAVVAA